MRTRKEKSVAVLTGDIVRSSHLEPAVRRRMAGTIRASVREAQKAFGKKIIPYLADIFRGDSWQLVVMDPSLGTRVGLFLRAYLRGLPPGRRLDSRIAVGVGTVSSIPHGSISEGSGRAFEVSGEALDTMPKHRRYVIAGDNGLVLEACMVVCALIDSRSRTWTPPQSRAVAYATQGLSQEEIASRWTGGITQQAVAKHLAAAGWHGLREGLEFIERLLAR
jgi:hypothetical protein